MFFKRIRRQREIGHRARMTMVSSAWAGLVLLALFISAVYGFYYWELNSAHQELKPALHEALAVYIHNPHEPHLVDIVGATADLSVAIYDRRTGLVTSSGNVIAPVGYDSGITEAQGVPVVIESMPYARGTVVAAVGWGTREKAIWRLARLLTILWFPIVCIFAIITWTSSRSTFAPLARLSEQAEALSTENLSARLEVEPGEYGEFAQRLNRFLERLEMSVRREERFVSDAAHELRTPLTVMRGGLETSLMRDRSAEEYRDSLREVLMETERLSGLVEMLLQSATLVDGVVPSLDLEEQGERAHARWVDRFAEHGVELELLMEPCTAKVKPRELDVILDNLLSNALKASPSGTKVKLTFSPNGSFSHIDLQDQGVGVPSDQAETIFERFTRLDQGRSRDAGGFGIGLAVCRRIAVGRGGRVYLVPSTYGAHFAVELPP